MCCLRGNGEKQWIKLSTLNMNCGNCPTPSLIPKHRPCTPATVWRFIVLLPACCSEVTLASLAHLPCRHMWAGKYWQGVCQLSYRSSALTPACLRPLAQVPHAGMAKPGLPAGIHLCRNQLHWSLCPCCTVLCLCVYLVPFWSLAGLVWSCHFWAGMPGSSLPCTLVWIHSLLVSSPASLHLHCLQPYILVPAGCEGEQMLQRSTGLCLSTSWGKLVLSRDKKHTVTQLGSAWVNT